MCRSRPSLKALISILILISGCDVLSHPGRVVAYTYDAETGEETETHYSEYMEFDEPVLGNRLRVHLIVTFGKERVPEGWQAPPGPFVKDEKITWLDRSQGATEEVVEVYFTNLTSKPLTVSSPTLEMRSLGEVLCSSSNGEPAANSSAEPSPPANPAGISTPIGDKRELCPSEIRLRPEAWMKTDPIIRVGIIAGPLERDFVLRFLLDGEPQEIAGVARRTPMDELRRR